MVLFYATLSKEVTVENINSMEIKSDGFEFLLMVECLGCRSSYANEICINSNVRCFKFAFLFV